MCWNIFSTYLGNKSLTQIPLRIAKKPLIIFEGTVSVAVECSAVFLKIGVSGAITIRVEIDVRHSNGLLIFENVGRSPYTLFRLSFSLAMGSLSKHVGGSRSSV